MANQDVIILGAGLSGLACAITLQKHRVKTLIIEPDSVAGGRVKSHVTQSGFIIDKGFQVILSSYPELENFVDISKLNLKQFNSGALIYNGQSLDLLANPLVHPETAVSTFFKDFITLKDKALVLKLIITSQTHRSDSSLGSQSTLEFLRTEGFSENFIEFFWRPFLAGVYLDNDLQLGESFFKFLIRCFGSGKVSVPAKGMKELPLQMAAQLEQNSVLYGNAAKSWSAGHVVLANGQEFNAKKVVCTFDSESSKQSSTNDSYHSVETIYFTSPALKELGWGKWLVLVPQKLGLGISHLCLLSSVTDSYGPSGPLLSVSIVGNKKLPLSQVVEEVNRIATFDLKLELVERVLVEKALPQIRTETEGFKVIDDVIHCGDRFASPSINGALRSGRLAAEFILKNL